MSIYLEDNQPNRRQYRARAQRPTGLIVVHTSESVADFTPPDNGAERVALFITHRPDPGSYHDIVDADTWVRLIAWRNAAYGVGIKPINDIAMQLAFACQAAGWATHPNDWVIAAIDNGARAAAAYATWLQITHGIYIPARRINRDQAMDGDPGFISHAELDPGRRSDPGRDFPWEALISRYSHLAPRPNPQGANAMTPDPRVKRIQKSLNDDFGFDLDEDGFLGPNTESAHHTAVAAMKKARAKITGFDHFAAAVNSLRQAEQAIE